MAIEDIPRRAGRILNFFLAGLVLIFIQAWIASSIHYDSYLEKSLKPMRRTVIERVERGTIRDRFNIPLAANRSQYNAAILYADIRTIPSIVWEKDERGKRKKCFKRREYIEELAAYLADVLDMDAYDIEDTIHGKACLFPHTPFVLREDIPEELFLKLQMAQKDWLGVEMQRTTKRIYPQGKLACDVVGYVGAISSREYRAISDEISTLRLYLDDHDTSQPALLPKGFSSAVQVRARLEELEQRAYTINDQVGKTGIESEFDQALRGKIGKSFYEVDIKGNPVRKLSESMPAVSGERLILSISAELQDEAEKLLSQYEALQDKRDNSGKKKRDHPWQRGGAIVAMDPRNGDVLALSSYPRFDPNDLVPAKTPEKRSEKRAGIVKWLESLSYIGDIWDGKCSLERERYGNGCYYTEKLPLSWETYLETILSKESTIYSCLKQIETLGQALSLSFELPFERDQSLARDLLQLIAPKELFSPELAYEIGNLPLKSHHAFCQTTARHLDPLKKRARQLFHLRDFRAWREDHFRDYLKKKRKVERRLGRYARPYTDYLEREEREQFAAFWEQHRHAFFESYVLKKPGCPYHQEIFALREELIDEGLEDLTSWVTSLSPQNQPAYLQTLRTFDDLDSPLSRTYPFLRSEGRVQKQKHLAAAFYPYSGFGYGRSQGFRQATPQGSIFKILTAYSGVKQQYEKGEEELNPLTLVDDMQWTAKPGSNGQVLGRFLNGQIIKRYYKGGRLPRAYPKIGRIGVAEALERTSNMYFSILAGDILDTPSRLIHDALDFGLGNPSGIDLPGEYGGILPDDIMHNKTGLYAFAIGQHSLVVTPLQTALMLSTLANGGKLFKPQILKWRAGVDGVAYQEPTVRDDLEIPPPVQELLIEGMFKVTSGEKGTARPAIIRTAFHDPAAVTAYKELHNNIAGKTGTAEIFFKQTLDAESRASLEKHTWFGGIGYQEGQPDIVVVVYNRFGTAGKQGAPIAAKLIKRWREIQEKHYNPG